MYISQKTMIFLPALLGLSLSLSAPRSAKATPRDMQATTGIFTIDTLAYNQQIPLNPVLKTGKLKNGFTYFIAKNSLPEKRVFIHLVNKVGSVQETEEQRGLAHFLEHMNFNGLKHFPNRSVIDYLQKYGVNFGADLNAHTSFEETIYKLKIPSGQPDLLKNSLQIARDWAQDATLDDKEIEKERGVIVEEMRGLRNADNRMREQYYGPIMNYSQFALRRPIGTEKVVTTVAPQVLKKFYKDWYRPDIQALIVIGDIDEKEIEQQIINLFSDMKMPEHPPKLEKYKIDLQQDNKFVVTTDPEATKTSGEFFFKFKETPVNTVAEYRFSLLRSAFNRMIGDRISEIKLSPNSPFNDIGITYDHLIGGADLLNGYFTLKGDDFEAGFKGLQRELLRIQQHGFNPSELQRYQQSLKKSFEKYYAGRDQVKSELLVKNATDFFLDKGRGADVPFTYQMATQVIPTLTVEEVQAFVNHIIVDWKRDILITAPTRLQDKIPTEAQINKWISEVSAEKILPYQDEELTLPLLTKQPIPGQIVSEKAADKHGITDILLSNGARVLLKKNKTKPGQIVFTAISPGGLSLVDSADYLSAWYAPALVSASGIGQYNASQLRKYLSGVRASVLPNIHEREELFTGTADSAGLKTMFEMLYGYFTAPRLEQDILNNVKSTRIAALNNTKADPSSQFKDLINTRLNQGNAKRMPPTKEQIEGIDVSKALRAFKDRFANAADFTFILVGDLDEAAVRPLLEQYVASLPRLDKKEKSTLSSSSMLRKGIKETIYKGKEDKTSVQLMYFGEFDYSLEEKANMRAMDGILNFMLTERLREAESGVYGISVSSSISNTPSSPFNLTISFGSSVAKTPTLIKSTIEEIEKLKRNGPTKDHFEKYMTEQRRNREVGQRGNYTWMSLIEADVRGETTLIESLEKDSLLDKINMESIKRVANKYLNEKKRHEFVLMPEKM